MKILTFKSGISKTGLREVMPPGGNSNQPLRLVFLCLNLLLSQVLVKCY
jgi:hypothetical protein